MTPPKKWVFALCLIVGIVTIVAHFVSIPVVGGFIQNNEFWFLGGSLVLLLLSCLIKGL